MYSRWSCRHPLSGLAGNAELADLDAAAALQVRAALGDGQGRVQVVGADHRVAAQLGTVGAGLAERGPGDDRLAQLGEMLAHPVEPGRPGVPGFGYRGV